jgi:hypothetical protein
MGSPATASSPKRRTSTSIHPKAAGARVVVPLETNGPSFRTHVQHYPAEGGRTEGAWSWYPDRERGAAGLAELAEKLEKEGWIKEEA